MTVHVDLLCITILSVIGVAMAMALGVVMLVILNLMMEEIEEFSKRWRRKFGRNKNQDQNDRAGH